MADAFSNINDLQSQGRSLVLLAPNDGANVTDIPKALLIGGTPGNISIDPVDGSATAVIVPVVAGQVFDAVRIKRLRSTGTTATPVYGIY